MFYRDCLALVMNCSVILALHFSMHYIIICYYVHKKSRVVRPYSGTCYVDILVLGNISEISSVNLPEVSRHFSVPNVLLVVRGSTCNQE